MTEMVDTATATVTVAGIERALKRRGLACHSSQDFHKYRVQALAHMHRDRVDHAETVFSVKVLQGK